eukprot:scaffold21991_cov33-Tisochrysis_lutea.AAC.1
MWQRDSAAKEIERASKMMSRTKSPTSPAVRITASACGRRAAGARLAACAEGAEPSKVWPAAHITSTAEA